MGLLCRKVRLFASAATISLTAEARRYCELLGAGDGCILGPVRLLQSEVPPEKLLAVYRA